MQDFIIVTIVLLCKIQKAIQFTIKKIGTLSNENFLLSGYLTWLPPRYSKSLTYY